MEKVSGGTILVVDDDGSHRAMLAAVLGEAAYNVLQADGGKAALKELSRSSPDAVLLDIRMSGQTGLEVLGEIRKRWPGLPVVMMTAYASVETAVEALKSGASDYLTKPLDTDEVKIILSRVLEHNRLQAENRRLRARLKEKFDFGSLATASPGMHAVIDTLRRVAPTEATVLILGESGTGKELVANAIHQNSPRPQGPFVPVNCAALPEQLLESELFGYEKGAFTGANSSRKGKILAADGGTLLLDEVGEMSPSIQAKLLRFLQERQIQPLGSSRTVEVDVRILAATNRDLMKEVQGGSFREDLYYRLNVVSVTIPPLRERREDISLLAEVFLEKYSDKNRRNVGRISSDAMEALSSYDWPGNVRELENAIERAVILCRNDVVGTDDLPSELQSVSGEGVRGGSGFSGKITLREVEAEVILQRLERFSGNKTQAAKSLAISRQTLINKLKEMG